MDTRWPVAVAAASASAPVPYESGVGIMLYPVFSAAPGDVGTEPSNRLAVDSAGPVIGTDDSGPGPARQTAPYQISTPVALPRGLVVSLDLGAVPGVERSPPVAGDWYAAQVEGDRVLLGVRDGLAADEHLTIEPR